MNKIVKIISLTLLVIVVIFLALIASYHIYGFVKPRSVGAEDLPIGEFIGDPDDISGIKDAYVNFAVSENPYDYTVTLPESYTVEPSTLPAVALKDMQTLGLWSGKGKINYWSVCKIGDLHSKEAKRITLSLWNDWRKHRKECESAFKKLEKVPVKMKYTDEDFKPILDKTTDPEEKRILNNLVFLSEMNEQLQTKEVLINYLNSPNPPVVKNKVNKEELKKILLDQVIGIKVNGNRAVLVNGVPDGLLVSLYKFVKIDDGKWKIYVVDEHPQISETTYRDLHNYWAKRLKH